MNVDLRDSVKAWEGRLRWVLNEQVSKEEKENDGNERLDEVGWDGGMRHNEGMEGRCDYKEGLCTCKKRFCVCEECLGETFKEEDEGDGQLSKAAHGGGMQSSHEKILGDALMKEEANGQLFETT